MHPVNAHVLAHLPYAAGLVRKTGATFSLHNTTANDAQSSASSMNNYQPSLADQFSDLVQKHMNATGSDFNSSWAACKAIHSGVWDAWQLEQNAVKGRAANAAKERPAESTTQLRVKATAEFTRAVNERLPAEGNNYAAAHSFVQQTQPRIYAMMMGDWQRDLDLEDAGHPDPVFRN